MKEYLLKIFYTIFPFIELANANKKINKTLEDPKGVLEGISHKESITTDTLKAEYENTLAIKDKLEGKAKSNIFAVTISITLVMGGDALLNAVRIENTPLAIRVIALVIYLSSILYLICAGLLSLHTLMNNNSISVIKLSSNANDNSLREDISCCIEYNLKKNITRNNAIYTTYICIRNGLICLFTVLLLSIIPFKIGYEHKYTEMNGKDTLVATQATLSQPYISTKDIEENVLNKDSVASKSIIMIVKNNFYVFQH